MEKGFNLAIFEFKQKLVQEINASQLPISVVAFVVKDLMNEINTQELTIIQQEARDYQEALNAEPTEEVLYGDDEIINNNSK